MISDDWRVNLAIAVILAACVYVIRIGNKNGDDE